MWLSGLGFVLQTIVVMPVVLVLAYLVAMALDGLLGHGIRLMRRGSPGRRASAAGGSDEGR